MKTSDFYTQYAVYSLRFELYSLLMAYGKWNFPRENKLKPLITKREGQRGGMLHFEILMVSNVPHFSKLFLPSVP